MSWTQKELEELYQKINRAVAEDPDFLPKAKKDPKAAVEELAGRPLEEGFRLNFIEQDSSYGDTYVLPEFVGEELAPGELDAIAGGKSAVAVRAGRDCPKDNTLEVSVVVIVSACAAAVSGTACGGDACGAAACPADAGCGGQACGSKACAAKAACAGEACAGEACGGHALCALEGCGGNACAGAAGCVLDACGGDACAAHALCWGKACGGDACGADAACTNNVCGGDVCAGHAACVGKGCAGDGCGAHGGCVAKGCIADICAAFGGCVAEGCKKEGCAAYSESEVGGSGGVNPLAGPSYDYSIGFSDPASSSDPAPSDGGNATGFGE